jgi:hypothetical protein
MGVSLLFGYHNERLGRKSLQPAEAKHTEVGMSAHIQL